jgi:glutaredoxin
MAELRSAGVPPLSDRDHVRGDGELVVVYGDYECPYCAKVEALLHDLPVRQAFRHFPVVSKHPRAEVLARAAEAAALQAPFWEMHDSLFADQGRLDDPHLWDRARELELDVDRFDADRRSEAMGERVSDDFRSGVRAGVMTTPTLFIRGQAHAGVPDADLLTALGGGDARSRPAADPLLASPRTQFRKVNSRTPPTGGGKEQHE